jgi:hypothetical protein
LNPRLLLLTPHLPRLPSHERVKCDEENDGAEKDREDHGEDRSDAVRVTLFRVDGGFSDKGSAGDGGRGRRGGGRGGENDGKVAEGAETHQGRRSGSGRRRRRHLAAKSSLSVLQKEVKSEKRERLRRPTVEISGKRSSKLEKWGAR